MDYSIEISANGKYLLVVIEVDITTKNARSWMLELIELSRDTGIKQYLYDVRKVKNVSNIADNYYYSNKDVSELNLDRSSRQAILVSPEDHSHDFIETTMLNAGYEVKIFVDESEAIEWLEK